MPVTQSQIKYIDDYLKYHKVDYWDIRIELLDHIVSKVETLMEDGKSFESALEEVHVGFGNRNYRNWNTGREYGIKTNGSGYENFIKQKEREINKFYRNTLFNEVKLFLISKNGIVLTAMFFLFAYYSMILNDFKWLKILVLILSLLPSVFSFKLGISSWLQMKKEKSIHIQFASLYSYFTIFFLPFFTNTLPSFGFFENFSKSVYNYSLLFLFTVMFIFNIVGLKVFKEINEYYSQLHKKLIIQ
jgi:hypothetical protein